MLIIHVLLGTQSTLYSTVRTYNLHSTPGVAYHHHHHQSRLTSLGRSALQLQRSTAVSHATSAEIPVSISTCRTRTHVCLGRPGRRFQCGLLSGRPLARVSTASRRAIRPGASSGSRRTCNLAWRRLLIFINSL